MFSTLNLLEIATIGILVASILQIMLMYHISYVKSGYNTIAGGAKKISGLIT
jgi:hypothetical protein